MSQSISEKRLKYYVLIIFAYLLVRMNSYFTRGAANEQLLLMVRLAIAAIGFLLLICARFIPQKAIIGLTLVTGLVFFLTGLQNYSSSTDILANLSTQTWWSVFLIVVYVFLTKMGEDEKKRIVYLGIGAFYVFALFYARWLLSSNRYWSSGGINSIYYCVLLLPLCYLVDKKLIRYSMLFLSALLTIISGKRTALISIVLCGFLPPMLEKNDKRDKKKLGTLLFLMVVCIALVYASEYLSKTINITILQRMQSLREDGGSGRTTTYALVWKAFQESSAVKQIFGHGYNAVYLDQVSISSAHNDFLEVLYDYGLVGLVLYVSLLIAFIKKAFALRSARCKSFSAYTAALLIFITLSCVSHLILYPTYIVFLLFVIAMGFAELAQKQSNFIEEGRNE